MTPKANVVHAARPRQRVRLPWKRGDGSYFFTWQDVFGVHSDVKSVFVNPRTGGALLISDSHVGTLRDCSRIMVTTMSVGGR